MIRYSIYFTSFSAFTMLLTLASCKTITTKEPHYETSKKQYSRSISYVNIPIEIPLQVIENKINDQFKGVIYDDDSYTKPTVDDVKIRVYLKNKIELIASGNELKFSIPLKIWAQGRYKACTFCPELEKQTIFEMDVYLRSKVEIMKDYSFKISTVSDGFDWKSQPKISFGPIDIPIGKLLENIIEKQLVSVAKEIDSNVNGLIDLRAQIDNLWAMAQLPVLLDDSTQTWLQTEPISLLLAPISSNLTTLFVRMGLETYLETYTGNKPPSKPSIKLPNPRLANRTNQDFIVEIRSELSFVAATEIARKQLLGQEFHFKKKVIRVDDIQIYGKGDLAYVKAAISGSFKGVLFLSGIPKFNSANNEFSIEELDYDIQSRNVLVKGASWLLNGTLQSQLQNSMRFSFNKEISAIREELSNKIRKTKYKKLFTLKGELKEFIVRDIYMAEDHFDIVLDARGNAKITFDSADFN